MVKFICLLLLTAVWAAPNEDEVHSLPGLISQPKWKQYSGYLQATGSKKLHYWFLESASSPEQAPLVLWMNGGPGCSSDLGLMTEHGPFRVSPDGSTVFYNKYSWNNVANMLYLEAPAGVGFSYSDDKNYTTDDDQVALDNHMAMKDFMKKFPGYAKHDFYVTGESYGGIYVPTLSARLVDDPTINFRGFAVGNGLSDDGMNDNSLIYFGYYHGLIGDSLWSDLISTCCQGNVSRCNFVGASGSQCKKAVGMAIEKISGSGLNEYNLYAECEGTTTEGFSYNQNMGGMTYSQFGWLFAGHPVMQHKWATASLLYKKGSLHLTPPCLNYTNVIQYLNNKLVRMALHIPDQVQKWEVCSTDVNMNYKRLYHTMRDQYLKVLNAGKRVLVYNGDVDMACNFLGDEWFVDSLGLELTAERKPWFYQADDGSRQVAGFVKQFKNVVLTTVLGAGHMVPQDKPVPALDMFTNFIHKEPF